MNKYIKDAYETAKDKGWHEQERELPELLALIHSEVSEVLEEYRNGHNVHEIYYNGNKPEGIPVELADILIRIFDLCGLFGIDITNAMLLKMEYNKTRTYRHGCKII